MQLASNINFQKKLDIDAIRRDFPILQQVINSHPLVYLDNAATTQKPIAVIKAIEEYYLKNHANIHRGVHTLSERATRAYEDTRKLVQDFINAKYTHEIIFTRGTTEAINLVAQSFGHKYLKSGDIILLSEMEHHSNIVPWQLIAKRVGATINVIPMNDDGELDLSNIDKLLAEKVKILAISHIANALGTINPIKSLIAKAHSHGIPVLIDGAQAIAHTQVDVEELDCDFYAFSSHKMYGPTGVGVLYGKTALLEAMPPYQGGGDMISHVTFAKSSYHILPYKFEAGTPNIADVVGFAAAITYLNNLGLANIKAHEDELLTYATARLKEVPNLKIIGTAKDKAAVISFLQNDIHPHDIGSILDSRGIAVRAGHHCAMPVMQHFNIPATARVSLGVYNTKDEIDALINGLFYVNEFFYGAK